MKADQKEASLLIKTCATEKIFGVDETAVHALRGIDLEIRQGEFMALVGPSGSGKTTLLNLLGALDTPTAGSVEVLGHDLGAMSKSERAQLRLHEIGFVFQAYNLVPVLTARENVEFVLELQGVGPERKERALAVLRDLGMEAEADRRPAKLSGGQQQRIAVARSVASQPRMVLADEPTANLDTENAEGLMALMRRLHDEKKMSFIFATHDPRVMRHADRVVTLEDGKIIRDEKKVVGEDHVTDLQLR